MTYRIATQSARVPLLRTKLFPVELEGHSLLPRQALIERLFAARQYAVLVLSAPAGYGKSTVLGQLRLRLQQAGARVAWLSCDEGDSEPPVCCARDRTGRWTPCWKPSWPTCARWRRTYS